MKPLIYKFGGASLASPNRMRNVVRIIQRQQDNPIVIVVSAIGKTTNALEHIVDAYMQGQRDRALGLVEEQVDFFNHYMRTLSITDTRVYDQVQNYFTEVTWLIEEDVVEHYDYIYDQIVSVGELVSSIILQALLEKESIDAVWLDARNFILTDHVYRNASIDWPATTNRIRTQISDAFKAHRLIVTQGFIGCTDDNYTTTLGREGSDYTGAIVAKALDAQSLTIWKDVPGVLNADPKRFDQTICFNQLSYREAVEMTFYGAQVIHPKTIKPLENKHIPLFVRSFLHPEKPGTLISDKANVTFEKAILVSKENQVVMHCQTKDFSFFDTDHISRILHLFEDCHCDINLLQNGAVQCTFVFDYNKDLVQRLEKNVTQYFDVHWLTDRVLLTLRHYNKEELDHYLASDHVELVQRTPETCQILYSKTPSQS